MATIEVTMLFLGSIIGAGFATGAEIVTFFGQSPMPIWLTAAIVGICIFLMITLEIMLFYPKSAIQKSKQPFETNKFLHIGIIMIYIILFTAMTAGVTQITNYWFCIVSLLCSTVIALSGIQRLSRFNVFIVIIIIVLIIFTALPNLHPTTTIKMEAQCSTLSIIIRAILYSGLNCFMFPELIIAHSKHKRYTLLKAGFNTAILVAILLYLILSIITYTHTTTATIPLLTAAPSPVTFSIILLAILTSQYTALFAIIKRTNQIIPKTKNTPLITAALICLISLLGSLCGFTHIIKYGYPLIGALTCFYLLISFLQQSWQALHQH